MRVLEELQHQKAVRKRLQQMRSRQDERDRKPFHRSILDRMREIFDRPAAKEHWLRCKLRWFADADWRKLELEKALNKCLYSSERMTAERAAIDLGMDINDERQFSRPARPTAEYEQLRRDRRSRRDEIPDWRSAYSYGENEPIILPGEEFGQYHSVEYSDESGEVPLLEPHMSAKVFLTDRGSELDDFLEQAAPHLSGEAGPCAQETSGQWDLKESDPITFFATLGRDGEASGGFQSSSGIAEGFASGSGVSGDFATGAGSESWSSFATGETGVTNGFAARSQSASDFATGLEVSGGFSVGSEFSAEFSTGSGVSAGIAARLHGSAGFSAATETADFSVPAPEPVSEIAGGAESRADDSGNLLAECLEVLQSLSAPTGDSSRTDSVASKEVALRSLVERLKDRVDRGQLEVTGCGDAVVSTKPAAGSDSGRTVELVRPVDASDLAAGPDNARLLPTVCKVEAKYGHNLILFALSGAQSR